MSTVANRNKNQSVNNRQMAYKPAFGRIDSEIASTLRAVSEEKLGEIMISHGVTKNMKDFVENHELLFSHKANYPSGYSWNWQREFYVDNQCVFESKSRNGRNPIIYVEDIIPGIKYAFQYLKKIGESEIMNSKNIQKLKQLKLDKDSGKSGEQMAQLKNKISELKIQYVSSDNPKDIEKQILKHEKKLKKIEKRYDNAIESLESKIDKNFENIITKWEEQRIKAEKKESRRKFEEDLARMVAEGKCSVSEAANIAAARNRGWRSSVLEDFREYLQRINESSPRVN